MNEKREDLPGVSRRQFMKSSSAALAGAAIAGETSAGIFHNSGREELRVGLIGCGGRGTGAAVNALSADPNTRLVAMGDTFADRLQGSLKSLKRSRVAERVAVDPEHCFSGFDAYKGVIASSDVVLLATTPHFRPIQLRAAVEAGKHIFCEKPIAVDPTGVRHVMETSELAARKNLSLVSGLCYRYQDAKQEVIKRIHNGDIGKILTAQCTYNASSLWHRGHKPEWSEMEYQIRNWLYFTWLSGDHIAEQSIHSIDKILWALGDEPPAKVSSSGGRIQRTQEKYGNIYDHFNCVFEWANGIRLFHSCRQWAKCDTNVSDFVFGTKGIAAIQHHRISGENPWRFRGRPCDMYLSEHKSLFKSIREGKPINNGDYMCKSTLMAIMGRMSAYTGKNVTWEQALNSKLDLSPPAYTWGDVQTDPVAIPGKTKLI